jgi:sugar phosphate isomerase/epimerase
MTMFTRRDFVQLTSAAAASGWMLGRAAHAAPGNPGDNIGWGLVTYQWGRDWDLPTLIRNCEASGTQGVELRTTHAHGVEPNLSPAQRKDIARRFADSEVTLVGIGSDERFDHPDPEMLQKAIDATKAFIVLSHDVGGTGVKVKPDRFYPDVPREKTIDQIGRALNELGEYATGFGQQVRLEVHGQCAELPTIKAIMDIAKNENVAVCWNSNPQDLQGDGLVANFNLLRKRFGDTVHVRELNDPNYPFQRLIELLVKSDYRGWMLLEASSSPQDRVAALTEQSQLFRKMIAKAQAA